MSEESAAPADQPGRYRCAVIVTVGMILLLVIVSMWLGWMLRAWWQA